MADTRAKPPVEKTRAERKEPEYTPEELWASTTAVFGPGISPDCVMAALRSADIRTVSKEAARRIVKEFACKEVK